MPVGGGRYEGMWGNKARFVDYDYGSDGESGGLRPDSAFKYLQDAIDASSPWDVIYIRPRDPNTSGGDPQHMLPESTTNWSIASTLHGLSLIGTGVGTVPRTRANQTRLQGASGATTAGLLVHAPYVNLENITFRRGSTTTGALFINGQGTGTTGGYAFNVTVNNCGFWKVAKAGVAGCVIDSAWHCMIANSFFEECAVGVLYQVAGSNVVGVNVVNSWFNGIDTTIDADIAATGGSTVTEVFISGCNFAHDLPALGSGNTYNKYIDFATASGLIVNCGFGTEDGTIATVMDTSNCDIVNCWYAPGTNLTDGT